MERTKILGESKKARGINKRYRKVSKEWIEEQIKEIFPPYLFKSIDEYIYFHQSISSLLKKYSHKKHYNKRLFLLRTFQRYSQIEIAEELGISPSAVCQLQQSIKRDLRNLSSLIFKFF